MELVTPPSKVTQDAQWRELNACVQKSGHLKRQYGFYFRKSAVIMGLFGLCVIGVWLLSGNILADLGIALLFGFVSTQYGLLAHSAIHGQIFKSSMANRIAGHAFGFGIGFSRSWWICKHNHIHHGNPNNSDIDGDINVSWLAFTVEQGLARTGFDRFMVHRQKWLFLPLLLLAAVSMWFASLAYLVSPKEERQDQIVEWALFLSHTALYLALVILFLDSWWHMILFFMVHKGSQGFYMGSVFATNHKAMVVLNFETSKKLSFLWQQVPTSRDVLVPEFFNGIFGGLNYQIEHHLFPSAPDNALGKIQIIVRRFCEKNNIPYSITGFREGMADIVEHLGDVASQVRALHKAASLT